MQCNYIHIAFNRHHRRAAKGAFPRAVQPVKRIAFAKQRCFRAVDVFRLTITQNAPAKGNHPPAPVPDGEHDAVEEEIARRFIAF